MKRRIIEHRATLLAAVAVIAIAVGAVLHLPGSDEAGRQVWRAAVALLALELFVEVLRSWIVDRSLGVDTIALVAMVGALALDEALAGVVVGLMFTGGAALEAAATHRARRELTRLVARAPRMAHVRAGDAITEVPVADLVPGDIVVVRAGEVIPVAGLLVSDEATLDTSTLTGEPLPVTLEYTAQTAGYRETEVRARVNGILLKRNYREGCTV